MRKTLSEILRSLPNVSIARQSIAPFGSREQSINLLDRRSQRYACVHVLLSDDGPDSSFGEGDLQVEVKYVILRPGQHLSTQSSLADTES